MPDPVEAVIRAGGGYTKYLEVCINLWTGTLPTVVLYRVLYCTRRYREEVCTVDGNFTQLQ